MSMKQNRRKANLRARRQELREAIQTPTPPMIEDVPAPPVPEGDLAVDDDDELDEIDEIDELKKLRDTLASGEVMVLMHCGDVQRIEVHEGLGIAAAAETVVATWVLSLDRLPHDMVSCTCYTDHATYGPFPVDVALEVTATKLRGDD